MPAKGQTVSAETRAKISAARLAYEAKRKEQAEHDAIHSVHPRCKPTLWQRIKTYFA